MRQRMVSCIAVGVFLLFIMMINDKEGFSGSGQPEEGQSTDMLTLLKDYPTLDAEGTFLIYHLGDFRWFCHLINQGLVDLNGRLEADINLSGEEIQIKSFGGNFDGGGYKISEPAISLFYHVEKEGRVSNLIVDRAEIKAGEDEGNAGGIACYNFGSIMDCEVYGEVEGNRYSGGIAAVNVGRIQGCRNYALVTALEEQRLKGEGYGPAGYGAGGIAGYSGTRDMALSEEIIEVPWKVKNHERCVISSCENYGEIKAKTLAGGICARLEDEEQKNMANYSLLELEEKYTFREIVTEQKKEGSSNPQLLKTVDIDQQWEKHISLEYCSNYGQVLVANRLDGLGNYTAVGGICGENYQGNIYRCGNFGRVMFEEKGEEMANRPMAITNNRGFSPTAGSHVVDCVSLVGMVEETMRHESIMEITEEQIPLWQKGELPYLSNNWSFQLEEAIALCELEPLGVVEKEASKEEENLYECSEFTLKLPEGFCVEEKVVNGECYALRIFLGDEKKEELTEEEWQSWKSYEAWILRKTTMADGFMERAWREEEAAYNLPDVTQKLYYSIPHIELLQITDLNLPLGTSITAKTYEGNRVFLENSIPASQRYQYMGEGEHCLGNVTALALEGSRQEGLEAKWLFLYTSRENNIHPPEDFIDKVNLSFYPDRAEEMEFGCFALSLPSYHNLGFYLFHEEELVLDEEGTSDWNRLFNSHSEMIKALSKAFEEGNIGEVLAKRNQPGRLLTEGEKELLIYQQKKLDDHEEHESQLVRFYDDLQGKWGEVNWYLVENREKEDDLVIQCVSEDYSYAIYHRFRGYRNRGEWDSTGTELIAMGNGIEHYFLESNGSQILCVATRDEQGEVEGVGCYLHDSGVYIGAVVYIESKEEVKLYKQYSYMVGNKPHPGSSLFPFFVTDNWDRQLVRVGKGY